MKDRRNRRESCLHMLLPGELRTKKSCPHARKKSREILRGERKMRRMHILGSLGVCSGKDCAGDHNKGLQEMPVWQQELRWGKDDLRLHRGYGTQKAMQTGRLPGSRSF